MNLIYALRDPRKMRAAKLLRPTRAWLGKRRSEETKAKIREAMKKR